MHIDIFIHSVTIPWAQHRFCDDSRICSDAQVTKSYTLCHSTQVWFGKGREGKGREHSASTNSLSRRKIEICPALLFSNHTTIENTLLRPRFFRRKLPSPYLDILQEYSETTDQNMNQSGYPVQKSKLQNVILQKPH